MEKILAITANPTFSFLLTLDWGSAGAGLFPRSLTCVDLEARDFVVDVEADVVVDLDPAWEEGALVAVLLVGIVSYWQIERPM